MNRNSVSPFGAAPGIKIPRSKISKPHTHKTTFNIGKLVPIYCQQVLPGQTVEMDMQSFIRLSTPVTPTMDELICDTYFFFVPNRFLWADFEKWLGANPDGSWVQTNTYNAPKLGNTSSTTRVFGPNDAAAYLGIYPPNVAVPALGTTRLFCPSVLPLRAMCKCWNDWFRNENLEREIPFSTGGDTGITGATNNFYNDIVMGYGLCPVNKTADVFTRSLPAPQKGDSVRIPLGDMTLFTDGSSQTPLYVDSSYVVKSSAASNMSSLNLDPSSLGTINDLRNAFAIQRMLERDARGGTRYIELLRSHFSVSNGDLTLGRSEYLGGKRFGINMSQVTQSGGSPNSGTPTPLGSVAGMSVTGDKSSLFTKSFTEHGWLLGFVVARIKQHTYSQGINRQFFFNTRYDIYWPELCNLGEFAVYKREIYAGSSTSPNLNNNVFGYQEAWYMYRYAPNRLSGYMATQVTGALSTWHYGDLYSSAPSLNTSFSHEEEYQLNRTLAVSGDSSHQFIADFFFNEKDVLPMPLYSVPGLVDHV